MKTNTSIIDPGTCDYAADLERDLAASINCELSGEVRTQTSIYDYSRRAGNSLAVEREYSVSLGADEVEIDADEVLQSVSGEYDDSDGCFGWSAELVRHRDGKAVYRIVNIED